MPRVVVCTLVLLLVHCSTPTAQPVTQANALETSGTLPAITLPFRRLTNPLDAIAPEDPPVPNRGLVAYIPLLNTALPQGEVLTAYTPVPGTHEASGGVKGSGIGYSYSVAFGNLEGNSTGRGMKISPIRAGSQGWTFAMYAKLPSQATPRTLLATVAIPNSPSLHFYVDDAAKQLSIVGANEVKLPNATFKVGVFHHLGVVFTPTNRFTAPTGKDPGTLSVYFDGQPVFRQTGTWSDPSYINFGTLQIPGGELNSQVYADEMFVYRTSLSEDELQSLYTKPQRGIARVWPTAIPVDVLDVPPYVQARANASRDTPGSFGPAAGQLREHERVAEEQRDAVAFTVAGWYYFPAEPEKNTNLFQIQTDNTGPMLLRVAVEGTTPYAEIFGNDNVTGRVQAGSRFAMRPKTWHFVALTVSPARYRIWLDGELAGETPAEGFIPFAGQRQTPVNRASYADVPTLWTVMLGHEATLGELESLRSPGPRVWLTGSVHEQTVSNELAAIGASGFTGPINADGTLPSPPEAATAESKTRRVVVPDDYGGHCFTNADAGVCDPVASFGGGGGVSLGRDGSFRLSKTLSGRVQIPLASQMREDLSVSFRLYLDVSSNGIYPIFARDFPATDAKFTLPSDVRIYAYCYAGLGCGLYVSAPVASNSTARAVRSFALPMEQWNKIAVSFSGTALPTVAIDGEVGEDPRTQEENAPAGSEPGTLATATVARLRFGYDVRETGASAAGSFDIDDIRVYGRALSPIELTALSGTCDDMMCDVSSRACFQGLGYLTPVCTDCLAGTYSSVENHVAYGMTKKVCEPQVGFGVECSADNQCLSGACSDGLCNAVDLATATSECNERRRTVRQQGTKARFICDKCFSFHVPPDNASKIDTCLWRPPKKNGDVVGSGASGTHDPDSTPGFATYECDSGHALTTIEPVFAMNRDPAYASNEEQANANRVAGRRTARVTVDTSRGSEKRSRCTPAMVDGCLECEQQPGPAYCTNKFMDKCWELACKDCSRRGLRCKISPERFPYCSTCRPNFRPQRAFLTPEACALAYNSLNLFQPEPSTAWDPGLWDWLFTSDPPFPGVFRTKALMGISNGEASRADYANLERKGVGFAWMKFSELPFWQQCVGDSISIPGGQIVAKGYCNDNFDELYEKAIERVGGLSLKLADCVRSDSAFASPYNDEICVAKKNPDGAACPPINPETGLPEEGNGDEFCESGFCGRELGVCTSGGLKLEKAAKKDANEQSSSGFNIGLFGVQMTHMHGTKHDLVQPDGRTSVGRFAHTLVATIMGTFNLKLFEIAGEFTTDGDNPPEAAMHYTLFGIPVPQDQDDPVAGCAGASWNDEDKWEGSGNCDINLDQPPGPPKFAVAFPIAEDALEKFEVKKRFVIGGLIPAFVKATPVLEVGMTALAGWSANEMEARIGARPSFSVGVEVVAAVGVEEETKSGIGFGISVGLRASITLLELGFPVAWVTRVTQGTDDDGNAVNRFYVVDRAEASIEFAIMSLAFSIYAKVEFFIFSLEWEYVLIELQADMFKKSLLTGPKREFVLDL